MNEKKNEKMLACPYCLTIPDVSYACGEYFTIPNNKDCGFCNTFNSMYSCESQLIDVWNIKVKQHHHKMLLCVSFLVFRSFLDKLGKED